MSLTVVRTSETEADRKWGYRFGCDGIVNLEDAGKILANASTRTVERRIAAGVLRAGYEGGRTVVCVRSIRDHIAGLEK